MYEIIWEYEVEASRAQAFEAFHGPDGVWARLFRSADGFLETVLFRDVARPGHYLTLDRWSSRATYEAFRVDARVDYERLDAAGAGLALTERPLGATGH